MTLLRIIAHTIDGKHRVDAMLGTETAQESFDTLEAATLALTDLARLYADPTLSTVRQVLDNAKEWEATR